MSASDGSTHNATKWTRDIYTAGRNGRKVAVITSVLWVMKIPTSPHGQHSLPYAIGLFLEMMQLQAVKGDWD